MKTCCSQFGNGSVHVCEDCYAWCRVDSDSPSDDFEKCLTTGMNGTNSNFGMTCTLNRTDDDGGSRNGAVDSAPKTAFSVLLCSMLALSMLQI